MGKLLRGDENNVYHENHHSKTFTQIGKKYLQSWYCFPVTTNGEVSSLHAETILPISFHPMHCLIACCQNYRNFRNIFMKVHIVLLRENPDKFGRITGNYFHTSFCPASGLIICNNITYTMVFTYNCNMKTRPLADLQD